VNGLRLGTPEIVRWGMGVQHMPELATLIARALKDDGAARSLGDTVTAFRRRFSSLHYMR
jgi:glycine hydroxymethyltransferase